MSTNKKLNHCPPSRFDDTECLRTVLTRLHDQGPQAWRTDPDAEELLLHAKERFARLAEKHGQTPDDGAFAAWEAMQEPGVVTATDPWGQIVAAVAITLRASEFADEALCSVETAREGGLSGLRAERFSEREVEVWEYHPGFAHLDDYDADSATVDDQADAIAGLFTACGWPALTVRAVAGVLARLQDAGSRPAAFESLRRNRKIPALAGLPRASWQALLRLLLGAPSDPAGLTVAGRGVLLRLACGETCEDLGADAEFCEAARQSRPPLTVLVPPVLDADDPLLAEPAEPAIDVLPVGECGELAA